MRRANPNTGILQHAANGSGAAYDASSVVPANSLLDPFGSYNGDAACRFLRERDEARSLYSDAVRDLRQMDFHLNAMQTALTISQNEANAAWVRLARADARIIGKIFKEASALPVLILLTSDGLSFSKFFSIGSANGRSSIGGEQCYSISQC